MSMDSKLTVKSSQSYLWYRYDYGHALYIRRSAVGSKHSILYTVRESIGTMEITTV
jgi:hypothetical protein